MRGKYVSGYQMDGEMTVIMITIGPVERRLTINWPITIIECTYHLYRDSCLVLGVIDLFPRLSRVPPSSLLAAPSPKWRHQLPAHEIHTHTLCSIVTSQLTRKTSPFYSLHGSQRPNELTVEDVPPSTTCRIRRMAGIPVVCAFYPLDNSTAGFGLPSEKSVQFSCIQRLSAVAYSFAQFGERRPINPRCQ